ncbi:VOC family protein [Agrobacterium sp. Ap1]|uniref:bleomycin resistance protein n=1 Tax=Agrobacterium sp. Ap1 TaxID=2815337 RepID=UPI001A8E0458|nr:VOC family protein [Agrobacterium sp. Ap1]MBO0145477.1 VOC family protein [Agrobacterium sp. Ap1]
MANALVPEFGVSNCERSKLFYCEVLGFECVYARPDEGFCYLRLGQAELMIDQIDLGRTFGGLHLPTSYPFGRGLNVQINVPSVRPLLDSLNYHGHELYLPLEEKWYGVDDHEEGNLQFVVADPDGYLLRFYEDLGSRAL